MTIIQTIIADARLRLLDAYIAILARFDRGIDGVVSSFEKLDRDLEKLQMRRRREVSRLLDKGIESKERELAAKRRERETREALNRRLDAAFTESERAARIRRRVNNILR